MLQVTCSVSATYSAAACAASPCWLHLLSAVTWGLNRLSTSSLMSAAGTSSPAKWGDLSLKSATDYHVKLCACKHGHRPVPCFVKRRSLQSEKSTASFSALGATACRLCCSSAMPANRAVEFGVQQHAITRKYRVRMQPQRLADFNNLR